MSHPTSVSTFPRIGSPRLSGSHQSTSPLYLSDATSKPLPVDLFNLTPRFCIHMSPSLLLQAFSSTWKDVANKLSTSSFFVQVSSHLQRFGLLFCRILLSLPFSFLSDSPFDLSKLQNTEKKLYKMFDRLSSAFSSPRTYSELYATSHKSKKRRRKLRRSKKGLKPLQNFVMKFR